MKQGVEPDTINSSSHCLIRHVLSGRRRSDINKLFNNFHNDPPKRDEVMDMLKVGETLWPQEYSVFEALAINMWSRHRR